MRSWARLLVLPALALACSEGQTTIAPPPSPAEDAGQSAVDAGDGDAGIPDGGEGMPPQARVSADPVSGEIPLTVRFDGTATSDPDGDLATLRWEFGDGATAEGMVAEHTYIRPGNYRAAIIAEDSQGRVSRSEVAIRANLPECPIFAAAVSAGSITSPILDEVSGLVASRLDPDLLWLNNDSGDGPRIYAVNARGSIRAGYELTGAQAIDWEDIAIGPGPQAGASYLYVGDIGDNQKESEVAPIYRIVEPTNVPAPTAMPSLFRVRTVDTIILSYGGGRAFNAETMMVDPDNGDLYVVTKSETGRSLVFRAPAPLVDGARVQMEEVGTLDVRGEATGGDMSPSGEIVIRTYDRAFLWRRTPGLGVADALRETPCQVRLANEPQGEAISFSSDGRDLLTTSEGTSQRVFGYARQ